MHVAFGRPGSVLQQYEHARSHWPIRATRANLCGAGGPLVPRKVEVALLVGSVPGFYRARRVLLAAACVGPLLLLGGAWWLLRDVILSPGVPDDRTSGARAFAFIVHERGLPRLSQARTEALLQLQIRRMARESDFREQFLSAYRTATEDEQTAFRSHLFDAFKPIVMRDVREFQSIAPQDRPRHLEDKVVEYNRLAAMWGNVRIGKDALGAGAPSATKMLTLLMEKTTEEERRLGAEYFQAYAECVREILADEPRKKAVEERIRAAGP